MHYLKFFMFHLYALIGIAAFIAGGFWIPLALVLSTLSIIWGDLRMGDDISEPEIKNKWSYNLQLWLALPLLSIFMLAGLFQFGSLNGILSESLANHSGETNLFIWASGVLYAGLLIGTLGTVTAHELVHRRWGSFSHGLGRWLLAYSFDSNFAIEHVFGHHINIATERDPASAPRGRTVYQHVVHSTIHGNISAWHIEKKRLKRQNRSLLSPHNRFVTGILMSILLMAFSFLLAGPAGLLFFILSGIVAKSLLEMVNYMEHYGLVRLPGKRVFPRHSWNSNNKISSWTLFNLTRHSHHHANASVPFQYLKPTPDAPMMPAGYLGTLGLTLVPSIWFKVMQPRLEQWDQTYASQEELAWLQSQSNTPS